MKIYVLLLAVCLLSGCARDPIVVAPQMRTDEQISLMGPTELCVAELTMPDPRLRANISAKKINCAPIIDLQQKRWANPAWAFCTDNGFKDGTNAMATCMSSWFERQQRQAQFQQQLQIDQQRADDERQRQAISDMFRPRRTNCNIYGSTVNCNSW